MGKAAITGALTCPIVSRGTVALLREVDLASGLLPGLLQAGLPRGGNHQLSEKSRMASVKKKYVKFCLPHWGRVGGRSAQG